MRDSKIEWTDHTFNPWIGCTKVSPGCANCYAETLMDTRYGRVKWGKGQPRQRTSAANWRQPLKWDKHAKWFSHECIECGKLFPSESWSCCGEGIFQRSRPRVFCASLADWLDDEVPIEWLADLLELIQATPSLDWLLLTKRPENWLSRLGAVWTILELPADQQRFAETWLKGSAPQNVWIGTTVEDQERADRRIPELLKIPAKVRFLSCEPLLGPVRLPDVLPIPWAGGEAKGGRDYSPLNCGIHWVICGGESGPGARPMHPDWARSLRDQCEAVGVPFLFKQWGEWIPRSQALNSQEAALKIIDRANHGAVMRRDTGRIDEALGCASQTNDADSAIYHIGKKASGRQLDGLEYNEFPNL